MSAKTILVVGGAGFIGSHINHQLTEAGYQTIVFDNLSRGFRSNILTGTFVQGDLNSTEDLENVFATYPIDTVMHFASLINVRESCDDPIKYYANNVIGTLNLIKVMLKHDLKTLIFSSTAAIYGNPIYPYIDENHPQEPINPYGKSKWMIEKILQDCDEAYGLKSCSFRYFNAAGGDPSGRMKCNSTYSSNLIPLILKSLLTSEKIIINGEDYPTVDGTCVRDYIHVNDLSQAHLLGMKKILGGSPSLSYNLGNGKGYSILEVIAAVEKVTGYRVNTVRGPRRPGDPPTLVANAKKAQRELGWNPQYPQLEKIIKDAWNSIQ